MIKNNNCNNKIDLSGVWGVSIDNDNIGIEKSWYRTSMKETVGLPGSTDQAGLGIYQGREQALAGHLTRTYSYEGAVWYQREVDISSEWASKRVLLFLERCHWETSVWFDDEYIGTRNSLVGPHIYTLPDEMKAGKHRITIRVDNSVKLKIGQWSNSICDETQTNWNGIIGNIELVCTEKVWLDKVKVYTYIEKGFIRITGQAFNKTEEILDCKIDMQILHKDSVLAEDYIDIQVNQYGCNFSFNFLISENFRLWDEFSPVLYYALTTITADISGNIIKQNTEVQFGIREISSKGRQLLINGQPTFLRGTIHNAEAPLTGYPAMDTDSWVKVIGIAKSYGLNHFRFHSWCPPEAAFIAADRLGFYFHVEGPIWTDLYRDYKEAEFLRMELFYILERYSNHPSFVMMGFGNELRKDEDLFNALLNDVREADDSRLYTCDVNNDRFAKRTSPLYNADYFVTRHTQYGHMRLNNQNRFKSIYSDDGNNIDYQHFIRNIHMPVISHELGQWAVHPDFSEISKYTGHIKPFNLEYFKENIKKRGLLHYAQQFQKSSGMLAKVLYKEDIEACLRTPEYGGFHLLQLQDFPGQGDALVGLLDVFWDSKGIVNPEEYREFCCETVPLIRMKKFVWYNNEKFNCSAEIANYGQRYFENDCIWKVETKSGEEVISGVFENLYIPNGGLTTAGVIEFELGQFASAIQLKLKLGIKDTCYVNSWDIWVYPAKHDIHIPDDVYISHDYDDTVKFALSQGKKVLLTLPHDYKVNDRDNIIKRNFLTVFWTFAWKSNRNEGSMGILCDPKHPAMTFFPTDYYSNFQWSELTNSSCAFIINDMPENYKPIVTSIDDFHRGFRLGHILEGVAGNGRVILCGLDLLTDIDRRPVARQMLFSLIRYMAGNEFKPEHKLDLDNIFRPRVLGSAEIIFASCDNASGSSYKQNIGIFEEADSTINTVAAKDVYKLIDGDWSTYWETSDGKEGEGNLHEVHIDLKRDYNINGILYKPGQGTSISGTPSRFCIYLSTDKSVWGQPAAMISIPTDKVYPVQHIFDITQNGRFVKLVVESTHNNVKNIAMAEIELLIDSIL